jgi:anti-anti-sigma factor
VGAGRIEITGCEVHMIGEFDLSNVAMLRECLEIAEAQGVNEAVINMARTEFIDSATIGVLVARHSAGMVLTLRQPSRQVRRTLTVAGVDTFLTVES